MLTTIRQEYETENDRKKTLDTKASTFITVNIGEYPKVCVNLQTDVR